VSDNPRIGVFRDALDFHRKRTVLIADDFYARTMDAARPRAMTVTGLQKYQSLLAVTKVIDEGIATNKTRAEIAHEVSGIVRAHGGTILSGERIELIVHNALFTANAAGEWKAAMQYVEDRPYFQYVGPRDGRNSFVCKPLLGVVVHYTDPILKHFWHPNHHRERQRWETRAKDEIDERKVYRSPDGFEYPVIDGRVVRPADGWDFNAADAMAADDSLFTKSVAELHAQPARKTASDYGLKSISDIDLDNLPPLPRLSNAVPSSALERAWQAFQELVGIENGAGTWALDGAGDGVRINRDTFDAALKDSAGNFSGANGRYFPLIRPTISDPMETWFVPHSTPRGTQYIKRYIGAYKSHGGELQTIVLDRSHDGWLWRVIAPNNIEAYRTGLLTRSKVAATH
jgi:Barnase-EndoU-ColicinE5/D-RelE like nuclease